MKNNFAKILFVILAAISVLGFSGQARAEDPLVVKFEVGPPLFSEVNFLPGESVTRWIRVTNNSGQSQTIAIEARNYSSPLPSDDLSRVLQIVIKQGSTTLYGPVLLSGFYEDSGQPGDEKVIVLSDLNNGQTVRYDITISFPSETANEWQGKTTGFDIVIGFKQIGETISPSPSPTTTTYGVSGGGGGMGGWYFLTPTPSPVPTSSPQVAGESVSREGSRIGGGFITAEGEFAESAEGETPGPTESAKPAAPAVAGESTCSPIPWWPLGYVLLLLILGTAQKMEKKVSSGGVILRIVLLVIALLWWWFEPCGARFWVWPVLMLVVFLVSLRFYFKKVSMEEIST